MEEEKGEKNCTKSDCIIEISESSCLPQRIGTYSLSLFYSLSFFHVCLQLSTKFFPKFSLLFFSFRSTRDDYGLKEYTRISGKYVCRTAQCIAQRKKNSSKKKKEEKNSQTFFYSSRKLRYLIYGNNLSKFFLNIYLDKFTFYF